MLVQQTLIISGCVLPRVSYLIGSFAGVPAFLGYLGGVAATFSIFTNEDLDRVLSLVDLTLNLLGFVGDEVATFFYEGQAILRQGGQVCHGSGAAEVHLLAKFLV